MCRGRARCARIEGVRWGSGDGVAFKSPVHQTEKNRKPDRTELEKNRTAGCGPSNFQ